MPFDFHVASYADAADVAIYARYVSAAYRAPPFTDTTLPALFADAAATRLFYRLLLPYTYTRRRYATLIDQRHGMYTHYALPLRAAVYAARLRAAAFRDDDARRHTLAAIIYHDCRYGYMPFFVTPAATIRHAAARDDAMPAMLPRRFSGLMITRFIFAIERLPRRLMPTYASA